MIKSITIIISAVVVVMSVGYYIFSKSVNAPTQVLENKVTPSLGIIPEPLVATPKQTYPPKPSIATETPKPTNTYQSAPSPTPKPTTTANNSQSSQAAVIWSSRDFVWYPSSTPPACPEPFRLQTPVDMSLVTGALWPGQVRGGYKAHGGFRFNNDGTNDINVRAPVGGHLIQASQYLEGGESQYFFVFSVPCGFIYRLDHLRVLSPKLSEAVKNLPTGAEGDSRTSFINPPVWIDAGEIVATSVGVTKNIFIDLGLYDVRKPNNTTPNPAWADLYNADKEFGHYGVCLFDYLPSNDGATMRSLPTGKEGKVSDYCK